jgi:secretion/DNA translocation related TadE-like protein
MIGVLLVVTAEFGYLGAAVIARHRAQAAADLAALAGAGAVAAGPGAACDRAAQVARAMRGAVTSCRVDALDVVLAVDVAVRLGRWEMGPARASARAGPVH